MPTKTNAPSTQDMTPDQFEDYLELSRSNPPALEPILAQLLKNNISPHDRIKVYNLLGYVLFTMGKLEESKKKYKLAYNKATKLSDEEGFADALVGLGKTENASGEFESAAEKFTQAIKIYQKLKIPEKEANVTNQYGINRAYVGNIDKSLELLNRSADLAKKSKVKEIELSARNNMALIQMNRGEIESAAEQFKICSEIAQAIGFKRGYANTLSNYAEAIQNLGEYAEAEINFKKAIEIAEEIKNLPTIAIIKTEMGGFFTEMGDMVKARRYLEEAMKVYETIDEKFTYVQCLNNYAKYWLANGDYHKSVEVLEQALKIVEDTNLSERKVQILLTLAQTHYALRNLDTAYSHLKEAIKLSNQQNNLVGKGLVLIERARLSLAYSNYRESELLLMEADEIAKKTNHFEISFNSLLLLAQTKIVKARTYRNSGELQEIANIVEKGLAISLEKKLWPRYINMLILRSILYAFEDQVPKALEKLENARTQAETRNMKKALREITRISILLQPVNDNPWNREMILRQIESMLTQEIQRITTKGISFQFTLEDVEAIFTMAYKIDEEHGTVLHTCENIQNEDPNAINLLNTAGSVYMMSLGRGQEYHQGLFGPFPYSGRENSRALVFSVIKDDPSLRKTRSRGHIYFITAYIYPQRLSPLFNDREKLEDIFINHYSSILEINEITPEFLQKLRTDISDYFLVPFLPSA
ncbi:MAG: tetratricopeptide repeat protein [Promethearchaeota archaeon]